MSRFRAWTLTGHSVGPDVPLGAATVAHGLVNMFEFIHKCTIVFYISRCYSRMTLCVSRVMMFSCQNKDNNVSLNVAQPMRNQGTRRNRPHGEGRPDWMASAAWSQLQSHNGMQSIARTKIWENAIGHSQDDVAHRRWYCCWRATRMHSEGQQALYFRPTPSNS